MGCSACSSRSRSRRRQNVTSSCSRSRKAGTAKPLLDFLPDLDLVLFRRGDVTKTLSVLIVGEKKREANETFEVRLKGALGPVTLADDAAIGTIVNDD